MVWIQLKGQKWSSVFRGSVADQSIHRSACHELVILSGTRFLQQNQAFNAIPSCVK